MKSFTVNGNEDKRLKGLRVLFVEDAADSREMLSFVLNVSGAVVTEAGAAAEAFELFQAESFDVLISDIGLPDEDGYSLMKRIRQLTSGQNVNLPAIALTAYTGEHDRESAFAAGFQLHIAKPVDPSELIEAVAGLTRQSE